MSYHITSNQNMSYHMITYIYIHTYICDIKSYYIMSCFIISNEIISYHAIPYHIVSYYIISCYPITFTSHPITPHHFTSCSDIHVHILHHNSWLVNTYPIIYLSIDPSINPSIHPSIYLCVPVYLPAGMWNGHLCGGESCREHLVWIQTWHLHVTFALHAYLTKRSVGKDWKLVSWLLSCLVCCSPKEKWHKSDMVPHITYPHLTVSVHFCIQGSPVCHIPWKVWLLTGSGDQDLETRGVNRHGNGGGF